MISVDTQPGPEAQGAGVWSPMRPLTTEDLFNFTGEWIPLQPIALANPFNYRPLIEVNHTLGRARMNLHPGQRRAWESKKRMIFVLAGTQSGKTSFGSWWLNREIKIRGPGDYLAVSANYDLFKLKMLPEMLGVFCNLLKIGRYWSSVKTIELCDEEGKFWAKTADDAMYSRIILRSAAAEAGLESATAKAAWLDEPGQNDFKITAWEAIKRRISLNVGRVLGTTTIYNMGWLWSEIYVPWRNGDPDIDVIQFDSRENPLFPLREYYIAQRDLPKWKHDMFYRGIFTKPAGMIFSDFDPGVHVISPFDIPPFWKQCVGIDPGAVNTATVWGAEDPETGILYIYHESLDGGKTTEEHCNEIKDQMQKYPRANFSFFGGAPSEEQFRMDWQAEGVPVQKPGVSDVEPGIDRMVSLIRRNRVYLFRNVSGLWGQMTTYSRTLDAKGTQTDKIEDKAKYHYVDAFRYLVVGRKSDKTLTDWDWF